MNRGDLSKVNLYAGGMLGIVVFSAICVGIRGSTFNIISEKIALNLRYDIVNHLLKKDIAFYDAHKTGDILSRISSDTAVVQEGLGTNISMFIRSFVFIVATLVLLFFISWQLTLVTLGGILPILLSMTCFALKMRVLSKRTQQKKAELGQVAEEAISNIRTVKAFACEQHEMDKFISKNHEAYKIGVSAAVLYGGLSFFTSASLYGCMAGVIYYGAKLNIEGGISVGSISAFLLYMIQLIFNFAIVAIVIGNVFKMFGASEKIIELMGHVPGVNSLGGITLQENEVVGTIEFKNVSFEYPSKKDVIVCKNLSLKVDQNKVVAIVGQSGCGKSSIISLIERFYDPAKGQILFSGVDVKKLDPRWYK